MQYRIDYQYMPARAERPQDDGKVVPIEATDLGGLVILPAVGDFVSVAQRGGPDFKGRVATRYFSYAKARGEWSCVVNIVVAEALGQDWGTLIKE